MVARLTAALEPDEVVLGGGNAKELKELPPKCRLGDNRNAFQGGFRLWEQESDNAPSDFPRIDFKYAKCRKGRRTWQHAQKQWPGARRSSARHGRISGRTIRRSGIYTCDSCLREDPKRGTRLAVEALGIYLDYSKNRITDETLKLLLKLAEESRLRERIDAMFRGEKINVTEKRAVLHTALRAPRERLHRCGWRERGARSACRARPDGQFCKPDTQRRMEGAHRQAHSQRDQRRHRRLRPRTGHGLRGAEVLLPIER